MGNKLAPPAGADCTQPVWETIERLKNDRDIMHAEGVADCATIRQRLPTAIADAHRGCTAADEELQRTTLERMRAVLDDTRCVAHWIRAPPPADCATITVKHKSEERADSLDVELYDSPDWWRPVLKLKLDGTVVHIHDRIVLEDANQRFNATHDLLIWLALEIQDFRRIYAPNPAEHDRPRPGQTVGHASVTTYVTPPHRPGSTGRHWKRRRGGRWHLGVEVFGFRHVLYATADHTIDTPDATYLLVAVRAGDECVDFLVVCVPHRDATPLQVCVFRAHRLPTVLAHGNNNDHLTPTLLQQVLVLCLSPDGNGESRFAQRLAVALHPARTHLHLLLWHQAPMQFGATPRLCNRVVTVDTDRADFEAQQGVPETCVVCEMAPVTVAFIRVSNGAYHGCNHRCLCAPCFVRWSDECSGRGTAVSCPTCNTRVRVPDEVRFNNHGGHIASSLIADQRTEERQHAVAVVQPPASSVTSPPPPATVTSPRGGGVVYQIGPDGTHRVMIVDPAGVITPSPHQRPDMLQYWQWIDTQLRFDHNQPNNSIPVMDELEERRLQISLWVLLDPHVNLFERPHAAPIAALSVFEIRIDDATLHNGGGRAIFVLRMSPSPQEPPRYDMYVFLPNAADREIVRRSNREIVRRLVNLRGHIEYHPQGPVAYIRNNVLWQYTQHHNQVPNTSHQFLNMWIHRFLQRRV